MSLYSLHDRSDSLQVHWCKPNGPHGRVSYFNAKAVSVPAYPGWYHVSTFADYDDRVECATRDPLGCMKDLQDQWDRNLHRQFCPGAF